MARDEGFTYNGYTVGGPTPTSTTQVIGPRFGWDNHVSEGDEVDTFVCEFIVQGTSKADLETKCAAMRSALRAKNQKLSVFFGAQAIVSYDPAVGVATGWDAKPALRKLRRRTTDNGFQRGFEFSLSVTIPSNYTDPNLTPGLEAGRRTSSVSLHWDNGTRRVVTISGKFFETAGQLPRAKTATAEENNPTGPIDTYCVARLAKIDPAAEWTIGERSESDNNTQTELTFTRTYYETINGRFQSVPEISYRGSGLRDVTIRGVYFRTYSASYDGSATLSATDNFIDAATGGEKFASDTLLALPDELGGALNLNENCELVAKKVTPNEQDDRLDYVFVYRELNFDQSKDATPLFNDPDIVNDKIKYFVDYTPYDDSKLPPSGGGNGSGPNPFNAVPSLDSGNGSGGSSAPTTVSPDTGGAPKDVSAGTLPTKPIMLKIDYSSELKSTVLSPKNKWYNSIRPFLLGQFSSSLGYSPTYLLGDHFEFEAQTNTISAFVVCVVLPGGVISYLRDESIMDELGEALDPAMTGVPYEYLRQQEFAERVKSVRHTVVYKTGGGSFDPSSLLTRSSEPGYVVISRSAPSIVTKTVGIPDLGVGVQELTTLQFTEVMKYVARNVGPPKGSVPNGAAQAPATVSPDTTGGN